MNSSDETNKDSLSLEGSLSPMSNINLENLLHEHEKSQPASPPPKSEKSSDEDDTPPPQSSDSNSSSKTPLSPSQTTPILPSSPSPKESPSKKSPPAPPPPPPPVASPPPPPINPPPNPRVTPPPPLKQSPHSAPPPPPPSLSQPPSSSPPPPPLSSDRGNPSPGPPQQSAPPPDSPDRSSLNTSSYNSPTSQPYVSVIFPSVIQNAPPPPHGQGEAGSIHPPPPHSPGFNAGSNTRPSGSSNDSVPSTSGGHGGSGNGGEVNAAKYVGIAFGGVCIVAFVAICFLVAQIKKRKRGAVHDASHIPPNTRAGEDWRYYGLQPLQDDHYKNGSHMASMQSLGTSESAQPMSAQTAFSYESIVDITNRFSSQNIIGEGGFGCVYKGWLADGRVVAVKKLKAGSGQGDREFRAEVEIISRVHHRHLVSLVGYCISEQQKILMYEFVPNGTLDHHLHGKGMSVLDWAERVKIAIGAARGLAYLHEDCSPKIIHRDIKSANILLDDAYVAKVADFGLARLTDDANTHVSTRVMGTFGYMAPEYATSGKLTDRSDVFSFGVVLLELLTGRKPVDQTQPLGEESLVEWARPHLIHAVETGDFSKLIDTRLENHYVESEVLRMIDAAAACVRHSAPKRPRMLQVVRALDSGGELVDLSNGMKYGQSTAYESGQYDEEIMRFRMTNGVSFSSSEIDLIGEEYNSRELSGFRRAFAQDSSGGEFGSQTFSKGGSSK